MKIFQVVIFPLIELQGQNYKFSRLIKDAAEHITRVGFSEETEE